MMLMLICCRSETVMSGLMSMSFDGDELGERSISTHDIFVTDLSVIQFDVRASSVNCSTSETSKNTRTVSICQSYCPRGSDGLYCFRQFIFFLCTQDNSLTAALTNFLPYLAMVKNRKIRSCDPKLWPMTLKFSGFRAVVKGHVRAKFHRAKCSG